MLSVQVPKYALPCPPKKNRKSSHSLISIFQSIVHDFENRSPNDISIMKVAKNNKVQHRRVYDFFNMLTSLNICQYIVKGKLTWVGVSSLNITLQDAYAKIEIDSIDIPMKVLFCVGPSPSLGTLAIKFLCLYMYLGVDSLFLKNVSMIFHDPRSDIKSLERRIYLILNFLEVLGTVSHSSKSGEYKLNLNVESIVENAMYLKKKMLQKREAPTIENLLNRLDNHYIENLHVCRREEFSLYTGATFI